LSNGDLKLLNAKPQLMGYFTWTANPQKSQPK